MNKGRIFISYKTGADDGNNFAANTVHDFLEGEGYDVWRDERDLNPGENWTDQIYENISQSDLIVLLLTPPVIDSGWVQREVDFARGARVFTLPVRTRGTDEEIQAVLSKLELSFTQYLSFNQGNEAQKRALLEGVEQNINKTREIQVEWLQAIREVDKSALFKEAFSPHTDSHFEHAYAISDDKTCRICVAAGDMTLMHNIDVLVNTENSYMQMARNFETKTLSAKLRVSGSRFNRAGFVREDSVQQALYDQISRGDDYPIPINMGFVIPTHAGHKSSDLVKQGARYILHVAAVQVVHQPNNDATFVALHDEDIAKAIRNCLNMVAEIDEKRGVISPEGTPQHKDEIKNIDAYQPIKSIMFPLFGTGRGGRKDVKLVAQEMLEAMSNYLHIPQNCAKLSLESIHLCGYSHSDVEAIKEAMEAVFPSQNPWR